MRDDRPVVVTTAVLVCLVLGLILIHGIGGLLKDHSALAAFLHREIALSTDGSTGEIVGYGLSFLAATLFFLSFVALRSRTFLFASVLMAFIWLDDSLRYHERAGRSLVVAYDLPGVAGLRPQDTGELLAWGVAGLAMALLLIVSIHRRQPGDLGALALLFLCFGVIVLFGVVLDVVHFLAPQDLGAEIDFVEDSGEMLALAMIAGIALCLARKGEVYRDACAAATRRRDERFAPPPAGRAAAARPVSAGQRERDVAGR